MPAELIGIVSQVDWSAGHAQVAEQIDKIKVAVWSLLPTRFASMGLSRRAGIRSVVRIVDWEKIVMGGPRSACSHGPRICRRAVVQWTPERRTFPSIGSAARAWARGVP